MRRSMKLAARFLVAFAVLCVSAVTPAHASQTFTDTFTRANASTWGNGWSEPYSDMQVASNVGKGTHLSAFQAATTLSSSPSAGATSFTVTVATGYVTGDLAVIGTGLATAEVRAISVSGSTITVAALTNAHSSGESFSKMRFIPALRPVGEARVNTRVDFETSVLGSTASLTWIGLRYYDINDWIGVTCTWNGSGSYICSLVTCVNGTQTTQSLMATYAPTSTDQIIGQVSCVGASPTLVTIKAYKASTGGALSFTGPGLFSIASTPAALQAAGQTGLGFADAVAGYVSFIETDLTSSTVGPTNANLIASLTPYTWDPEPSYISTNYAGSGIKTLNFTGTSIGMTYDTSQWQSGAGSTYIEWSVDNGPTVYATIAPGSSSVSLATNLAIGTHTLQWWWVQNIAGGATDVWTVPTSTWRITGLTLDTGESILAPTLLSKNMLVFGDSIMITPTDSENGGNADPAYNAYQALALQYGCNIGVVGLGGQAISVDNGSFNAPPIITVGNSAKTGWDKLYASKSRLVGGLFSPPPDYIFFQEGTNDALHGGVDATLTTNLAALIAAWRAAAPLAKIVIVTPYGGFKVAPLSAGVALANDPNTTLVVLPSWIANGITQSGISRQAPGDGLHPNLGEHVFLAMALGAAVDAALMPQSTSKQLTRTRK